MTTRLFSTETSWINNSFKPDLVLNGESAVTIFSVAIYTVGLPLYWLLILLLSARKITHLLIGSGVIFVFAAFAIFVKLHLKLSSLMLEGTLWRVFTPGGYIKEPDMPFVWLPGILKPLTDLADIIVILVLPILLVYVFCHKSILERFVIACALSPQNNELREEIILPTSKVGIVNPSLKNKDNR